MADAAAVLRVIAGPDGQDPSVLDVPLGGDSRGGIAGLRIGFYPADLDAEGAHAIDRAVLDVARDLGADLVPLRHPAMPYEALLHILNAEAAASFEQLTLADEDDTLTRQDADAWPNTFRAARFLSAVDHVQLDRLRRRVMMDMDAAFAGVDAVVGPAVAGPMLIATNFSGHPCIVLPAGLRADGTPHAVCVWGRLFDEATALRVGRALEEALGVWREAPPLFRAA